MMWSYWLSPNNFENERNNAIFKTWAMLKEEEFHHLKKRQRPAAAGHPEQLYEFHYNRLQFGD